MFENYPVLKNAEPFYYPGNHIGVLVSHGFAGTTQTVHELGKSLAGQGYTVLGPRLPGHGTHVEDFDRATHLDWINTLEEGLAQLSETCTILFVTGLSMGGTLTLFLAEKHPEIAGIMTINAGINVPKYKRYLKKVLISEDRFLPGIGSDIKADGVNEFTYNQTPINALNELVHLLKFVRRDLHKITAPTLLFSSVVDHVIPAENAEEIYDRISSRDKQIVHLKNSYHVALLDHDKDLIIDTCIHFIKRQLKNIKVE